jgi:hypothetical protein
MREIDRLILAGTLAVTSLNVIPQTVKAEALPPDRQNAFVQVEYPRDFWEFVGGVADGTSQVRGVYFGEGSAFFVKDQPKGNSNFVTSKRSEVSLFTYHVAKHGTNILLAHNTSPAGIDFSGSAPGDNFVIVLGNGGVITYEVQDIERYRAIEPSSTRSNFVKVDENLIDVETLITANELMDRVYTRSGAVVFQTCIKNDVKGRTVSTWGRIFVIAYPIGGQSDDIWKNRWKIKPH